MAKRTVESLKAKKQKLLTGTDKIKCLRGTVRLSQCDIRLITRENGKDNLALIDIEISNFKNDAGFFPIYSHRYETVPGGKKSWLRKTAGYLRIIENNETVEESKKISSNQMQILFP